MSHASITRRRDAVRRKRRLQRRAELVQFDRIIGGPVVADREQASGVERRTADHRIGVHDAQTGHHEHVAAGRTGIERPQQELLEGLGIAAVDRAQKLRLGVLAVPQRDALCARLEVEIHGGRHRRAPPNLRDFLERGDKRVLLARPVVVAAQIEQRGPFRGRLTVLRLEAWAVASLIRRGDPVGLRIQTAVAFAETTAKGAVSESRHATRAAR